MDSLYDRSMFVLRFIGASGGMAPDLVAIGADGLEKAREDTGALRLGWKDLRKMASLLPVEDLEELKHQLVLNFGYRWETDSVEDLLMLEKVLRTGSITSESEEAVVRSALELEEERPNGSPERAEELTALLMAWESGRRGG